MNNKLCRNQTDREFQSNFRLTRHVFGRMLELVRNDLNSQNVFGSRTVNLKRQLLSVSWLLSTPDSFCFLENRISLEKLTLWAYFKRVIRALSGLAPVIIKWPNHDETVHIEHDFAQMELLRALTLKLKHLQLTIMFSINKKIFYGLTL